MSKNNFTIKVFTGTKAAAEAMRQINPEVVAAYPITPQTAIVQKYSEFVADGKVDSELVPVESEHSAMSVVVGASAAGVRAMTATSSAGLALMFEILGVASGLRLPIVMNVVNRALSSPINIHCDHSDSMGTRDHSWIQIYSENNQEVYENTLLAVRLAEHPDVLLPAMVMQDGFISSHCAENTKIFPDEVIRKYLGKYQAKYPLLDVKKPVTIGPLVLPDYQFEIKRQQAEAMKNALKVYLDVGKELSKITGSSYLYFEEYMLDDAQAAIVTMSSTAGTTKVAVDEMRKQGKRVGLLKIKLFRPFPYQEVAKTLSKIKTVGILDRSESFGAYPPLAGEIGNTLPSSGWQSYVFGIGGRDIDVEQIRNVFEELLAGKIAREVKYVGLRE